MGVVYRAIDTRLGRVVALKMIPREALGREDLRRRMLREARAAAMLNHPNVCAVYDVDDSLGFLVMECIEGAPLSEVLRRGPLDPAKALDIARQISDGVTAAHQLGITHRDIKPANIMLTHAGQVKITDFGLAKCSEESLLTLPGQIIGTPAYMAPEQIRGGTADERSDIWSFGIVLYELLTGSLPFRGENMTSLLYSIVHDEPQPIAASAGSERTRWQPVVDLCLAKSSDKRYQRMRDVAQALGAVITDSPVSQRDPLRDQSERRNDNNGSNGSRYSVYRCCRLREPHWRSKSRMALGCRCRDAQLGSAKGRRSPRHRSTAGDSNCPARRFSTTGRRSGSRCPLAGSRFCRGINGRPPC